MDLSKVVPPLKEPIYKGIINSMFEVYQPRVFVGFILFPEDMCPSLDIIPIIVVDGIKGMRIFFLVLFGFCPKDAGVRTLRIWTVECVMFDASL